MFIRALILLQIIYLGDAIHYSNVNILRRALLIFPISITLTATHGATNDDDYTPGVVANKVFPLRKENFRQAIEDPANPLWFLKFYAPWYVVRHVRVCILLFVITSYTSTENNPPGVVIAKSWPQSWIKLHQR
jgi:hypothetical protein